MRKYTHILNDKCHTFALSKNLISYAKLCNTGVNLNFLILFANIKVKAKMNILF